ncbi:hypothetical protein F8M41_016189 [Gigaspora margarita]|uniref:Uncharacterized protein n=1 Tax=Gigaspora margarita TaxID=4874 RepID=A0A8H4EMR8_GIGMA|nr:hypothetical protein F8M41_016189 [Gigaspora margarita]
MLVTIKAFHEASFGAQVTFMLTCVAFMLSSWAENHEAFFEKDITNLKLTAKLLVIGCTFSGGTQSIGRDILVASFTISRK